MPRAKTSRLISMVRMTIFLVGGFLSLVLVQFAKMPVAQAKGTLLRKLVDEEPPDSPVPRTGDIDTNTSDIGDQLDNDRTGSPVNNEAVETPEPDSHPEPNLTPGDNQIDDSLDHQSGDNLAATGDEIPERPHEQDNWWQGGNSDVSQPDANPIDGDSTPSELDQRVTASDGDGGAGGDGGKGPEAPAEKVDAADADGVTPTDSPGGDSPVGGESEAAGGGAQITHAPPKEGYDGNWGFNREIDPVPQKLRSESDLARQGMPNDIDAHDYANNLGYEGRNRELLNRSEPEGNIFAEPGSRASGGDEVVDGAASQSDDSLGLPGFDRDRDTDVGGTDSTAATSEGYQELDEVLSRMDQEVSNRQNPDVNDPKLWDPQESPPETDGLMPDWTLDDKDSSSLYQPEAKFWFASYQATDGSFFAGLSSSEAAEQGAKIRHAFSQIARYYQKLALLTEPERSYWRLREQAFVIGDGEVVDMLPILDDNIIVIKEILGATSSVKTLPAQRLFKQLEAPMKRTDSAAEIIEI